MRRFSLIPVFALRSIPAKIKPQTPDTALHPTPFLVRPLPLSFALSFFAWKGNGVTQVKPVSPSK